MADGPRKLIQHAKKKKQKTKKNTKKTTKSHIPKTGRVAVAMAFFDQPWLYIPVLGAGGLVLVLIVVLVAVFACGCECPGGGGDGRSRSRRSRPDAHTPLLGVHAASPKVCFYIVES